MDAEGLKISSGALSSAPNTRTQISKPAPVQTEPVESQQKENVKTGSGRIDPEQLQEIAEELNQHFQIFNTSLSFSVDEKTGTTVIKILDRETDKVIREIPPSELLKLAAKLSEVIGRLVDETV